MSDQSEKIILETVDLSKAYQLGDEEIPVLHDVNMQIRHGDFTAIMGPSGSGKSTLLNILGCLDTPTGGQYLLDGKPVDSLSAGELAEVRNHQIGFVFQNFNLLPKLSVRENVELPLIYGNVPKKIRREMVASTLEKLGIYERRFHRPNEISGGQKQRVAIARALVKNPSVILADEPTGNLDSTTTREIMALIASLHEEGHTILLITHEPDVAEEAGRTLLLRDGRIEEV